MSDVFQAVAKDGTTKTVDQIAKIVGRSKEAVKDELSQLIDRGFVTSGAAFPHPDPKQRALGSQGRDTIYWPTLRGEDALKKGLSDG